MRVPSDTSRQHPNQNVRGAISREISGPLYSAFELRALSLYFLSGGFGILDALVAVPAHVLITAALFDLDLSGLCDLGPSAQLERDEHPKVIRRIRPRIGAEIGDCIEQLRRF